MSKHRPSQRILAMAMSIVMVLGMTPVTAMAQTTTDTSGEIIAFEALSEETANREVSLGISLEDLNLPGTLNATVRVAVETDEEEPLRDSGEPEQAADEPEPAVATPSDVRENQPAEDEERIAGDHTDPDEPVQATTGSAVTLGESGTQDEPKQSADPEFMEMNIPVPVEWDSSPDYDADKTGIYTFTAKIEAFTVRAELPQITVTVGTPAGVVTAFAPLADEIRWQSVEFGTAWEDLNLPGTLPATVEGETADVSVTWESAPAYDANTKGLYLFTAQLDEGWSATAELPHITVVVRAEQPKIQLRSFGGGAQSTDPFLIGTAAQLAEITALTNGGKLETMFLGTTSGMVYLKLDNDIDLSGYASGEGWVPIGNYEKQFKGSFDGGGHVITGLTINRPDEDYIGLFGSVDGGAVKNLGVVNVDITGDDYVGGIVGEADNTPIKDCYSTGHITGKLRSVGGVVGSASLPLTVIENCYSTAAVEGVASVGGIAGIVSGSFTLGYATLKNCAALNPSVCGEASVNRVAGVNYGSNYSSENLIGNVAFSGMFVHSNINSGTVSGGTAVNENGEDKTAADLKSDGTLGGLFPNNSNPWTYSPGMLPGFGAAVDMPAHIVDGTDPNFRGAGTETNPYQISTPEQLAELAELVNSDDEITRNAYNNKHYKLMNDLDLSGYASGEGWVPIGTWEYEFKGRFDGGGHVITGLVINRPEKEYQGLFGTIQWGVVENLGLDGVRITGYYNVGGVSGYVRGTVKNCYTTGVVTGTSSQVGGVAGSVVYDEGKIESCYSTAAVSGEKLVGGVAGYVAVNAASLKNCVALNTAVIAQSAPENTGRVIGLQGKSAQVLNNAAFSGMTVMVGGAVQSIAGLANDKDGSPKAAAELQTADAFPVGLKNDPWTYTPGKLPGLGGTAVDMPAYLQVEGASPFEGAGTSESDPYLIKTAADLARLAELVNDTETNYTYGVADVYYMLMNDLDLSDIDPKEDGSGWVPIGDFINKFKGSFDGGGHTISNLTINRSDSHYQGLFGHAQEATISNLGIVDAAITGKNSVGGVAGDITGGSVNHCYITGSVSGTENVGGVAGYVSNSGTVQNCYSTGSINGTDRVGGVVGFPHGTVENCYSTGSVSGEKDIGGIAGHVSSSGTVQNCAALNLTVSGTNNVGRVAGCFFGDTLNNNYAYKGMDCASKGGDYGERYDNGTFLTSAKLFGSGFWTTAGNWRTSAWSAENWEFADGKLPILKYTDDKVMPGQSGAPDLYLLNLSTDTLTVTLSGTGITGSGTAYAALASYEAQTVNIKVEGWEDWTEPLVTITAKKAANDETITISPIENGKGTFLIPTEFSGNITVTAQSTSNPNNKTAVTLTVNKRVLTAADFSTVTIPTGHVYNGTMQGLPPMAAPIPYAMFAYATVYYNGNPTVPTGASTYIVTLHYAGDDVYNATEEYGFAIGHCTIAPKPLTISGVTAVTREYDGTDTVALSGGGALFGVESVDTGKLGRDMGIGTMEDANAGDGKAVTTNIQLTGTAQSNYTLTQPDVNVNITKKALSPVSATVLNKEYDGNTNATVTSVTFTGLVKGETLLLGTDYIVTGKFHDANVNTDKLVAVTPTLLNTDIANNYSLSDTQYHEFADITKKAISGTVSINVTQGGSGDASKIDKGDTLTADISGIEPSDPTLSYQWYRNGTAISGATASTYTVAARATDPAGSLITVKVTGTGNYTGDKTSAAVEIGRIPLEGSVSIDGTPNLSHTLTLNTALLTPSGATTSVQWLRDGTAISGAIGNNYAITKADLGKSISVSVTGTGEYSGTETAEISISAVVPETPTNFSAAAGNGQVTLSWTAPFDGGSALTKYQLSKDDGANWQDIGLVTTYTVTGLANGTQYIFKLRAVNSVGESAEASVTATPVRPSGGSGGGSYTPPAPPATPAPQWLEQSGTSQAISDAKEQGTSQILTRASGQYGVRQATWAAFVGHQFWHDTMDGNAVQVRTYIKNPIALTADLLVSGYVKGTEVEQTKALFERFFANKVRTIHMDQTGAWGQTIELAAKVDLTGMDITKLYIYSYDKATNTYRRIEKPAYWVDTNGYLHFYTALAGDIIISEGPLARIENGAK